MEQLRQHLNLGGRRKVPFVRQSEAGECGLACIAMVANYYGLSDTLRSLRSRFAPSLKGMTLRRMAAVADAIGLRTEAVRIELDALSSLKLPAILHWDLRHFVVLSRVVRRFGRYEYVIIDPGAGERRLSHEIVSDHFSGIALEAWVDNPPTQERLRPSIKFSNLWRGASGLGPSVVQIVLLSAFYQCFALAAPALSQWGIDTIVPSGNSSLVITFILIVVALGVLAALSAYVRLHALLVLTNGLGFHIIRGVFDGLMKRKIEWFQKRSVADIVSRFSSVRPIARSISTVAASVFVDGFTSIAALILMIAYSGKLALVAVTGSLLVVGLRVALLRGVIEKNEQGIALEAIENGNLMETIRGIQTVKLFNMEAGRRQAWIGLKARAVNAQIALGKRTATLEVGVSLLSEIDRAVIIALSLLLIIEGAFTLGMLVAFAAYAQFFRASVAKLSELWVELGVARLHLERIAEIIEYDPGDVETDLDTWEDLLRFESLELRDVSFRYAQGEPFVLSNVNLTIHRGDMIVIVGPSGEGKTTLFKILLGALQPESGQLFLNGRPLLPEQMRHFRTIIGAVTQDDVLYAGTILDNISFFDPLIDSDLALQSAMTAQISDDILRMPMTFQTLVGDMGSALSGGQKQRLLLARALYRTPQILFMDEGTSNLDVETECKVHSALSELDLTVISVAHRPHALAAARRVIQVSSGNVTELTATGISSSYPVAVGQAD